MSGFVAGPLVERVNSSMDSHDDMKGTNELAASFLEPRGRRALLKGAAVGISSLAAIGAGAMPALAADTKGGKGATYQEAIVGILTVARTAEQLAVTFYSNGIANADKLGLKDENLAYIKAALVEEQIHQLLFTASGGKSLATTFSFPKGQQTFEDLKTFIETQQQLEGVFDSAFLAAIKEFAMMGRPDLAQLSGQIACIEAEHRALGRAIGGLVPADNWAFTPVLLKSVADAPALVKDAGYLSPVAGNSYTYQQVSIEDAGVEQRKPYTADGMVMGKG